MPVSFCTALTAPIGDSNRICSLSSLSASRLTQKSSVVLMRASEIASLHSSRRLPTSVLCRRGRPYRIRSRLRPAGCMRLQRNRVFLRRLRSHSAGPSAYCSRLHKSGWCSAHTRLLPSKRRSPPHHSLRSCSTASRQRWENVKHTVKQLNIRGAIIRSTGLIVPKCIEPPIICGSPAGTTSLPP